MIRSLGVAALSIVLFACSSATDDEKEDVAGPPPADPVVYSASEETKDAVGITKWGYSTDAATRTSAFRGYGEKNELLVEITQTIDDREDAVTHVSMTMTGKLGAGSEKLDLFQDGDTLSLMLIEDTFAQGSVESDVLARLAADASADAQPETPSLVGKSRPLTFVGTCSETTQCEQELLNQREVDAVGRQTCALVNVFLKPLLKTILPIVLTGGEATLPAVVKNVAPPVAKCAYAVWKGKQAQQAVDDCKARAASCQ